MNYIDPSMLPMLDTFIFETTTLLDQLDEMLLVCEKTKSISNDHINEIFRVMHTTKGSAAMMGLDGISSLAHKVEDVFFIIREHPDKLVDVSDEVFELVFQASDYFKTEIDGLQSEDYEPGGQGDMVERLLELAAIMKGEKPLPAKSGDALPVVGDTSASDDPDFDKQLEEALAMADDTNNTVDVPATANDSSWHIVRVFFEDGCQMENIRAFMLMSQLKDYCAELTSEPANPESDSSLCSKIVQNGFVVRFVPDGSVEEVYRAIESAMNVKSYESLDAAAPVAPVQKTTAPIYSADEVHTARVFFEKECQMENVRAIMLVEQIRDYCDVVDTDPKNPEKDAGACAKIVASGFIIRFRCACAPMEICQTIANSLNIATCECLDAGIVASDNTVIDTPAAVAHQAVTQTADASATPQAASAVAVPMQEAGGMKAVKQSLISVNQTKLDHLMDLVGEIVTAESMVSRNPGLTGVSFENFSKSTRELRKLTDELQDVVMSMRMVPLSGVFQKMNRIVRDMCKKLGKEADLVTIGAETEVDKNINDSITDPFMHMIRNSIDHAIELPEDRVKAGKPRMGTVTMSAQNIGGEIVITISDDGAGLNKEKILAKARKNGLLTKAETDYTEKEIFNMIMMAGLSTNENVTEFSGRGVGMDVVRKNLEAVGGSVSVDSKQGEGTTFTIKIPLTLAIMDAMEMSVGNQRFMLPITSIRQSFKVTSDSDVIVNTDGSEMILIRGECYPIVRLHKIYGIETKREKIEDGILIWIENNVSAVCMYVDELLGEQQMVAKPFPVYLGVYDLKSQGISGCTILGDGSISLILDANSIINSIER